MRVQNDILQRVNENDIEILNSNYNDFWEGITSIGNECFLGVGNLKYIYVPSTIKKVGKQAFTNCSKLEKVILSKNLLCICEDTFYGCTNLKTIVIPNNVSVIEKNAFGCCRKMTSIKLGKNLKVIGSYAFFNCFKLAKIVLPNNVEKIEEGAFYSSGLKKIYLNKNLKEIEEKAFAYCKSLETIVIPDSVKFLGKGTFEESSIRTISIGQNITYIPEECFHNCKNLERITIPQGVRTLKSHCFANSGLKEIKIKDGLMVIEKEAFLNCIDIEQIEIPKSVIEIGEDAFKGCKFNYIYKLSNGNCILSKYELVGKDIVESYNIRDIGEVYCKLLPYNNSEALERIKLLRKNGIVVTNECYENIGFMKKIFYNDNYDFMKKLSKKLDLAYTNKKYALSFYTLLYNLGAFSDDMKERQKSCNFIENLIDKYLIRLDDIQFITQDMDIVSYNPEWAEFIMNNSNFLDLIKIEKSGQYGLIAKTCNDFNKLKEFCRSNKGKQRYLKPTVTRAFQCFSNIQFDYVNETNEDIALELAKFTIRQSTFDEASDIREVYLEKRKSNRIDDHILKEELKENIFDEIDSLRAEILNDSKESTEILSDIASERFTYEFLSKYDPINFVIGKYCTCCAHLEGAGKGVVYASVLNPDCQNLVIRDNMGLIVAKAMLYINREQGYGVFNNFEVNDNIDEESKELIYAKIKKGVSDFANKYNELNKDKPITQINVGMGYNDLNAQVRKYEKRGKILQAIDFSADLCTYYDGDWQDEQYVIWKK